MHHGRYGNKLMIESNFWRDRRVLITGCTGMLGSWLTIKLLEMQADVVGIIRDYVPHSELIKSGGIDRINVVRGTITDSDLLMRVFSDYEIQTCIHLAAQTAVGIANNAPVPTFETNIRGTWIVLDAARRWPGVEQVLVASSDKAYGSHKELPYSESAELKGNHPYDVSKSCTDMIANTYAHTFGLPVAITRCANMYGGGDLNWNRIVPGTMRSVINAESPIIRSDGSPKRDYIYVKDVVSACIMLIENLAVDPNLHMGQAYNFGADDPVSAIDMVNNILKVSGSHNLEAVIQNTAVNEIQDQYLSSSLAEKQLGWKAEYSLVEGLSETLSWYKTFLSQK